MKILNGALDIIIAALDDLAANRLPLPAHVRAHNARKAAVAALQQREELKLAIMRPYLKEGSSAITVDDEGFDEVLAKVKELFLTEIEVDFGGPVDLSKLDGKLDGITLGGQKLNGQAVDTIGVLMQFGLLITEAE